VAAVVSSLKLLNDSMQSLNNTFGTHFGTLQSITQGYREYLEAYNNIADVIAGRKDWNTGELKSEYGQSNVVKKQIPVFGKAPVGSVVPPDINPPKADQEKAAGAGLESSVNSMLERVAQYKIKLQEMTSDLDVRLAKSSGKYLEASFMEMDGKAKKQMAEIWATIEKEQGNFGELAKRADKAGGSAKELEQAGRALAETWSTSLQSIDIIKEMNLQESSQAIKQFGIENAITLAGIKKEYYELAGTVKDQRQAQDEYVDAVLRRNLAESKTPEIADWYRKLAEEQKKTTSQMSEFAVQAAHNIQDALGDQLYNMLTGKFDNIASDFGEMLAKMAAQATAAEIGSYLFGDFGTTKKIGGVVGDLFSWASGLFGGGRASGGSASAGTTYLVGERGPELFTPKNSGTITPNGAFTPNVTVNVKNETGSQVESDQGGLSWNGESWVLGVVLRNSKNNEKFRNSMRSMIGGR
jgi:hypothetical protein